MTRVAEEIAFDIGATPKDGVAPPLLPDHMPGTPAEGADSRENSSQERMQRVISILEDENETDLAGAMRLLAVEIAATMSPTGSDLLHDYRNASGRIKNLRELSKQIQEAADMSSRDFLNFDGPRFQFVFREVVTLFRASMVKGGLEPRIADHVLRVFYEEFLAREQRMRQETSKLDPSTMASAFSIESNSPDPTPGEPHA